MISGATGSMAVIMTKVVVEHGIEYLFWAVILCGIIQILLGLVNVHLALEYVTFPVKLGFLNGLALVIAKSQLESYMIPPTKVTAKTEHFHVVDFNIATNNYVKIDKLVMMLV